LGGWIVVLDQPGQLVHETPISKITRAKWAGGVLQAVKHLQSPEFKPQYQKKKKPSNNKCCQRCSGEEGTLMHCWWECKLVQPLWKAVYYYHMILLYHSWVHLKESMSAYNRDICTHGTVHNSQVTELS
jgi:hypothetical protein